MEYRVANRERGGKSSVIVLKEKLPSELTVRREDCAGALMARKSITCRPYMIADLIPLEKASGPTLARKKQWVIYAFFVILLLSSLLFFD